MYSFFSLLLFPYSPPPTQLGFPFFPPSLPSPLDVAFLIVIRRSVSVVSSFPLRFASSLCFQNLPHISLLLALDFSYVVLTFLSSVNAERPPGSCSSRHIALFPPHNFSTPFLIFFPSFFCFLLIPSLLKKSGHFLRLRVRLGLFSLFHCISSVECRLLLSFSVAQTTLPFFVN